MRASLMKPHISFPSTNKSSIKLMTEAPIYRLMIPPKLASKSILVYLSFVMILVMTRWP